MIFKYGSYAHTVNEGFFTSFDREPLFSERGQRHGVKLKAAVKGVLIAATQAELLADVEELINAYNRNGQDFVLCKDDGSPILSHCIISNQCLGGTKVTGCPSLEEAKGAVLGTFYPYHFTVEGEAPDPSVRLLAFRESLKFSGGGPRFEDIETKRGVPQVQLVSAATMHQAVQSGRAVGQFDWPDAAIPLWPAPIYRQAESSIDRDGPETKGPFGREKWTGYELVWNFVFKSPVPLIGVPRFRIPF